jgi:transcriptional regulator with XRE-family HTH domain
MRLSDRHGSVHGTNTDKGAIDLELDRQVIRCRTCGLTQYRTGMGNCRRCLRLLTPKIEFLIPYPESRELLRYNRQLLKERSNRMVVENIGQRIRQLRESRGLTQRQLRGFSGVSSSLLSRIENGQITPTLGTLERISEALGTGLNRLFVQETTGEILIEDPFIHELLPFLHQLDWEQWQSIQGLLAAISKRPVAIVSRRVALVLSNG